MSLGQSQEDPALQIRKDRGRLLSASTPEAPGTEGEVGTRPLGWNGIAHSRKAVHGEGHSPTLHLRPSSASHGFHFRMEGGAVKGSPSCLPCLG